MGEQESKGLQSLKQTLIAELEKRVKDKILENENKELLVKLISNADSITEAQAIMALGTTYKRTGFHFDKRLEHIGDKIFYLRKNKERSFKVNDEGGKHTLIIGDNYPALQNLLITYKEKVKVIYIDPPYGKDDLGEFAKTNYHNAITRDNLLSMLYPRLQLAKELLKDDGVIFCSIDNKNQAYVKCLFDEVFGEENFVSCLCVVDNLKGNNNTDGISKTNEYCLVYAKNRNLAKIGELNIQEDDEVLQKWNIDELGYWKEGRNIKGTGENAPREKRPSMFYPIYLNDNLEISLEKSEKFHIEVLPLTNQKEMCWNWSKDFLQNNKHELIVKKSENGFNFIKKQRPTLGDIPSKKLKTTCYSPKYSTSVSSNTIKEIFNDENVFNYSKSIYFIKDLLQISTTPNAQNSATKEQFTSHSPQPSGLEPDIVLDFFAGSGTTAHAVLELNREDGGNRQFILVTNNEITELNPNGIAKDVTSKRLRRIMSGECYDKSTNFKWREKNAPYGGILEVLELAEVSEYEKAEGKSAFEVIDETCYVLEPFKSVSEKIK